MSGFDAKKLSQEVIAVAMRLHALAGKDDLIRNASTPGVLAGMALYTVLTARALGMAKDVHELVDAVDHDFPTIPVVDSTVRKLVVALEADDPEAAMRAIGEMLGVALRPKVDEKAVADADKRADEIIRKMAETLGDEPKGD